MKSGTALLLDIGGQGCRALAIDNEGAIRFEASRRVDTRENGSLVEQDAQALANAVDAVANEGLKAMDDQSLPVAQAALAVQRGSIVCWDRMDGRPLSPVISWRDRRGLPGIESKSEQAGEIRKRCGLRFSPYGGASKIAWCLQELKEVQQAREQSRLVCGPLGSFLLARLLAERPARTDDTLAQRTLLWSRETCDWDDWLLEQFGVTVSVLPEVVPSRSTHGHLRRARQVPLELLMGDQNCVPFLNGRPDQDTLYINLGTGAFLLRPLIEPVDDERFQLTLLDRDHECRWALEGSVHGAASAVAWLERTQDCSIRHERMEGLRDRIDQPPLFINSIDGLGSPWWCSGPEPAFVEEHDEGDVDARLLAVLESIAFLIATNVEAMNDSVTPPRRIVLSGGLSRSATLCGLIADILEIPVTRLESAEATALGLWCRLHDRALPGEHFQTVTGQHEKALMARYDRWRSHIEAATKAS